MRETQSLAISSFLEALKLRIQGLCDNDHKVGGLTCAMLDNNIDELKKPSNIGHCSKPIMGNLPLK